MLIQNLNGIIVIINIIIMIQLIEMVCISW